MIALLVLYAAGVGAVLGAAAWLLERAALAARRPARWLWAGALVLGVALPVGALVSAVDDRAPAAAGAGLVLPVPNGQGPARTGPHDAWTSLRAGVASLADRVPATLAAPSGWAALDRPLVALWIAATALALWRLHAAAHRAQRLARGWAHGEVAGGPVRVSADVGPAVVGALRPEVVVPAWALADPRLDVMLAHEREHLRARDPLLLAAGTCLAALMPWSPAAWWQLRRLRAAAELDCDRRVLAGGSVDLRAYVALLLDVAGRAPAAVPALALATPPTLLHRRIEAMALPRSPRTATRAVWPAAIAAGLVALACEVPQPTSPATAAATSATSAAPAPHSAADAAPTFDRVPAPRTSDVITAPRITLIDDTPPGTMTPVRRLPGKDAPPLYVIDGKIVSTPQGRTEPAGLDADAITGVNVLKGPSATLKYGERGRNGVVEITTKAAASAAPSRPSGGGMDAAVWTLDGRPSTRAEVERLAPDSIATMNVVRVNGRDEVQVVSKRPQTP